MNPRERMIEDIERGGLDAADAERAKFRPLNKAMVRKLDGRHSGPSAYAIPYFDRHGKNTGFSRWRYAKLVKTKKGTQKYGQTADTIPQLYIPRSSRKAFGTSDRILVVEGEKKALKAAKEGLLVFGIGGVWNWGAKKKGIDLLADLKELAKDRDVDIAVDGDAATKPDVMKGRNELALKLVTYGARVFLIDLPDGLGVDDYLVRYGRAGYDALPRRAFDAHAQVDAIRRNPTMAGRAGNDAISQIVIRDMRANGVFLRTPDGPMYFDRKGHRPILLVDHRDTDLRVFLNIAYGVNGAEHEHRFLFENLTAEATANGAMANPQFFSYRAPDTGHIYVAQSESRMFRVTEDGQEVVPNGTDSVILRVPSKMEPIELPKGTPHRKAFDALFRLPNIVDGEHSSAKQMRMLRTLWTLGPACGGTSALPTRPILLEHGPKGSGKTTGSRGTLKTFFGASADVITIDPRRLDGLDAALTNQHLVVCDNVDGKIPGLDNRLATAATGGNLAIRQLYTSNKLLEIPARAFLTVTSREPDSFTRDDVVDRLLYVRVARREEKFVDEGALMRRVLRRRGRWWAYVLSILPQIVRALNVADTRRFTSEFRMADFARFAIAVAPVLGYDKEGVIAALRAGEQEKDAFVVSQSLLPESLAALVEKRNQYEELNFFDKWMGAGTLLAQLRRDEPGFRRMTAQALGQKLVAEWEVIRQKVPTMESKLSSHDKGWRYRFVRAEK